MIFCGKKEFPVKNGKIALVRGSMFVTYYIKLFRTGADIHNGILMSLLLLVTETISDFEWMLSNAPQFLKFFVGVKFFNVE